MRYRTRPLGLALRLSGLYRASAPAIEAFPLPPQHTIGMAPTINWRKRTRHSKGYNLRKQPTPVPSGIRQIKQARQAEAKIVRKKQPASTARYSVLNNQQTMVPKEAPKEAPKLVFDRDAV